MNFLPSFSSNVVRNAGTGIFFFFFFWKCRQRFGKERKEQMETTKKEITSGNRKKYSLERADTATLINRWNTRL